MLRLSAVFCLALLTPALGSAARADSARLITQSTSSDCGPAALATLLTFYLDIPAQEAEIMRLASTNPTSGTSLKGLEAAAAAKKCDADSFRMDYATLQNQLRAFGTPVIVRMLNPEPHFAVVLEANDKEVGLSDPAVGNIIMSRKAFLKRWIAPDAKPSATDGYVFVAARPDGRVNAAAFAQARRDLAQMRRALETKRAPLIPTFR